MAQQKFRVNDKASNGLFIRTEPLKKKDTATKEVTKIALLPMGQLVTKKAESNLAGWWEVSTILAGVTLNGFVNSTYLTRDAAFTPPDAVSSVTSVHLTPKGAVTRGNKGGLAYPLNEAGQPTRTPTDSPADKAEQLNKIVKWLDVENKARYGPNTLYTYCNIYAYDYCYLAGVFLPRVWWTGPAIERLKKGNSVRPIYAETVNEMNANSLFNWLKDYGPTFGWNRTFDFSQMQSAANNGQVVIICGQNKKPNRSGHITAVVPETSTRKAERAGGAVKQPLQSQAGRANKQYMLHPWWYNGTFRDWGYWINAS